MDLENVDTATVAAVLDLTTRRVQQLVKANVIPRAKRGSYSLPAVVKAWTNWLVSGKASGDLASERRKLTAAQARIKTVEAEKLEGEVFPAEDVRILMSEVCVLFVQALESLPGRFAGVLPGKNAAEIYKHVLTEVRSIRVRLADKFQAIAELGKKIPPAKKRKPATPKKKPRRKAGP